MTVSMLRAFHGILLSSGHIVSLLTMFARPCFPHFLSFPIPTLHPQILLNYPKQQISSQLCCSTMHSLTQCPPTHSSCLLDSVSHISTRMLVSPKPPHLSWLNQASLCLSFRKVSLPYKGNHQDTYGWTFPCSWAEEWNSNLMSRLQSMCVHLLFHFGLSPYRKAEIVVIPNTTLCTLPSVRWLTASSYFLSCKALTPKPMRPGPLFEFNSTSLQQYCCPSSVRFPEIKR